jgi:hypothetical protein
MATTNFVPGTVVASSWLNDVDAMVYGDREIISSEYPTLQEAFTAAAGKTLRVVGSNVVTSAITVSNNTRIIIEGNITTTTPNISILNCIGKSNIHFFGPGKIGSSVVSGNSNIGSIDFNGAIDCLVMGLEFAGYEWQGVRVNSSVRCHVAFNYIHDGVNSNQDSAGVGVMRNCVDCSVFNNTITNPGWHGILVQDPGGSTVPLRTKVESNIIDGASAYGIACYQVTAADQDTHIIGNIIRNITGTNPGGGGGTGIYVASSGGVKIRGNTIKNICTATTSSSLTPAGIGINGILSPLAPTEITGNSIYSVGVTAGGTPNATAAITLCGINVTGCTSPTTLTGNTIKSTAAITPSLNGIYLNVSSNVTITGAHSIALPTTGSASDGVFVFANGGNVSNINISGVTVTGGTEAGIRTDRTAAFTTSGFTLASCGVSGGGASMIPFSFTGLNKASIGAGCVAESQTFGFVLANCLRTRVVDAVINTSGSTAVSMSGTSTGSFIDASVDWGTSSSLMSNTSTGGMVSWRSNTVPATGVWAVGDTTEQSVPAVGSPKRWRCTVAGTPGTWVSEGNL